MDKPTSKILCETLKARNGTRLPMSHDHAIQLYDALRKALEREHIKPDQGEEDPDAEVCQEVREVRAFLKNEAWIFLPDTSSRKHAFENHWEPHQGTFFATSSLAVNDQSSLFLKTSDYVTEDMARLAAEAAGAQALNAILLGLPSYQTLVSGLGSSTYCWVGHIFGSPATCGQQGWFDGPGPFMGGRKCVFTGGEANYACLGLFGEGDARQGDVCLEQNSLSPSVEIILCIRLSSMSECQHPNMEGDS